jgi:two-component system, NarL family, response regulator
MSTKTASAIPDPIVIKVLVADDHYVVRQGLRMILEGAGMQVVAEARSGTEAAEVFIETKPDVCIIDMRMPQTDGLWAIKKILEFDKTAKIVALSSFEGDADIKRALDAGAATYVLKRSLDADLPNLIRAIALGSRKLDRQVRRTLTEVGPRSDLTEREIEVLKLIASGQSNKDVAQSLEISVHTVNNHVSNILLRLDATDRTQAVTIALRRGLVQLG